MARRGLIIFAAWTAFGLFFFTEDVARNLYFGVGPPWYQVLVGWLLGVWIAALATPIILAAGERYPLERRSFLRNGAIHVGLGLILTAGQLVADAALLSLIGPLGPFAGVPFGRIVPILVVLSAHGNLVSYVIVLGIQYAARWYRRLRERELHAAELQT